MKIFKQLVVAAIMSLSLLSNQADADSTPPVPTDQITRLTHAVNIIKHYYIKKTDDKMIFDNAIKGMISHLDPHSAYLDKKALKELNTSISGKFVGIGIEITTEHGLLKVISPLEGTPAEEAGIKPNDLIIKVNGKLVQDMTLQEAVDNIKGIRGTKVALTILRKIEKKPLVISVTRDTIKLVTVKKKILSNGYGYIRITFFQGHVDRALHKAIRALKSLSNGHLKGLVLDLRNNPGGLLNISAKVADTFLDARNLSQHKGLIVYTKGRIPGSDITYKASPRDMIPGVPMIVLINGGSASASEIVAGALQDYKRAVIAGTRSFGKGSVQTVIPISNTTAIKLTTALYYTPSGRVIQAHGITPDVIIPQLIVDKKNLNNVLNIDEQDFGNHIPNGKKIDAKNQQALKKQRKKELTLAKEDYQLYEALLILKGINAIK
jgi:carboxyl-terminal processing protease